MKPKTSLIIALLILPLALWGQERPDTLKRASRDTTFSLARQDTSATARRLSLTGDTTLALTGGNLLPDSLRVMPADSLLTADSLAVLTDSLSAEEGLSRKDRRNRKKSEAVTEYSDEYLDTVKVEKVFELNDYLLVGVEYGVSISRMMFNPSFTQTTIFSPNTFGVFFQTHEKMFGQLPYFGMKAGVRYSHEGYKFKENKETGVTSNIEGATSALIDLVEVPLMAHMHFDALHFKVMADLGIYGGYRLSIDRYGDNVSEDIRHSFIDTDRRFDYGICGGVGFGIVFDPLEFHFNANVRYSWGTIYDPDYVSKDYYRFAYPFDVIISGGVYFQLTRRTGRSRGQLRREAKEMIYNPQPASNENVDGAGR